MTAVAVQGDDCVVIVAQKKVSSQALAQDKLLDPQSLSSIYNVTPNITGVFIGIPGDCRAMVYRARQKAADFQQANGIDVPVPYLVQKIANINQVYTQHAYMRLHACVGILVGIDEDLGGKPQIYRFDPAGWYTGNKAACAGHKEQEAVTQLEKALKKKECKTQEDALLTALLALQSALGQDIKANDVEVGIVTREKPTFTRLSEDEIDAALTKVSERD